MLGTPIVVLYLSDVPAMRACNVYTRTDDGPERRTRYRLKFEPTSCMYA